MHHYFSATRFFIVLWLGASVISLASPITSIWAGGNGSWSDPGKWVTPPGIPGAGYQVLIDNGNPVSSSVLVDMVTPVLNNVAVDSGDAISVQQRLSAEIVRSFGSVGVLNGGVFNVGSGGFVQDQVASVTTVFAGGQLLDTGSYSQGNGSTTVAGTLSADLFHVTGGSVTAANGGTIMLGSGGYTQDQSVNTTVAAGGALTTTGAYSQGNGSTFVGGTLSTYLLHVTGGSVTVGPGGVLTTGSGGYTQGVPGTVTTIKSGGQLVASGGAYSQEIGTVTDVNGALAASVINNSGTLTGSGSVTGVVNNLGIFAPGDNGIGSLLVAGAYNQSGILDIDIGGAGLNDFLFIAGPASLGGTLDVNLLGGYLPTLGSSFDIMGFTSRTGDFDVLSSTNLPAGEFWQRVYTPTDLVLTLEQSQAVPEPRTVVSIFGAFVLLLLWGRKAARANSSPAPGSD